MAESRFETSSTVYDVAKLGFGKGTNQLYDRARPSYPFAALSAIRAALTSPPPYNVLEIGSGTGIFTRAIFAHPHFSDSIRELRAVEPSEGMREQFSLAVTDPRVSIMDGTFERTHVPDGWADLIVVGAYILGLIPMNQWLKRYSRYIAQAFHWCPDHNKAMAEFSRALSPAGVAIFIWNLEDDKTAWVHQVRQIVEAFEQGTPQYRLGLWRQVFQASSYIRHFQPPQEFTFHHTMQTTKHHVIERALSKSYIAIRSDSERGEISNQLDTIVEREDGKMWIDAEKGTFLYPYENTVVIMRKN